LDQPRPPLKAAVVQDISLELHWSSFPEETRSSQSPAFHPDAPTGRGFWYWVVAGVTPKMVFTLGPVEALARDAMATRCGDASRAKDVYE
jgi:phosphatidylethanolamine-binding protein (PEBP) family uncharacterized protein